MPRATLRITQADVDHALPRLREAIPALARVKRLTLGTGDLTLSLTLDTPLLGDVDLDLQLAEGAEGGG